MPDSSPSWVPLIVPTQSTVLPSAAISSTSNLASGNAVQSRCITWRCPSAPAGVPSTALRLTNSGENVSSLIRVRSRSLKTSSIALRTRSISGSSMRAG